MEETIKKLKTYGQEHLINHLNELSNNEMNVLLNDIQRVDFDLMKNLYYSVAKTKNNNNNLSVEPMGFVDREKLSKDELQDYINSGENALRGDKLAFVTMAGGQGTRLGHNGPKGTFVLAENKSLFEILCDTLKRSNDKYNISIPWYIMTSRDNNDETVRFFEEKNYFGYNKENVMFFEQNELPMLLEDGSIVLETPSKIKFGADGHGGVFYAMNKSRIIEDMIKRGIEWIFIGGVDNCLLKMVDPLLIGLCKEKGYLLASKTIPKRSPEEKVGVFCKRNGRPYVIEYSEITKEMANERDEEGQLVYSESHILCNMFNIEILKKFILKSLPYHVAHKKSDYIDKDGNLCVASSPNAYKFETFIFDAFSEADDILLLRTKREDEFAPLKNKEGEDSVETARKLYLEFNNKKGE